MSYIRSLSNPEGLYIWADVEGGVVISVGSNPCVKVNEKDFNKLLRTYAKDDHWDDETLVCGTLTLKEEEVVTKCPVPLKWYFDILVHFFKKSEFGFTFMDKIRALPTQWEWARYKKEFLLGLYSEDKLVCHMHTSTMYYLAHTNSHRED